MDQDLKNSNADNVALATTAVCIFCSILVLLVLLSFNCICLLSRAPEVVELEEGKENWFCSGRIQPNMRIPARHVHTASEQEQRKWRGGAEQVQEMPRVTLCLERAAEELSTQWV